jgi:hypothetical protein
MVQRSYFLNQMESAKHLSFNLLLAVSGHPCPAWGTIGQWRLWLLEIYARLRLNWGMCFFPQFTLLRLYRYNVYINLQYKNKLTQAPVAHTCNPSYSGGRDQEDRGSKPAQENTSWDPIWKKPKHTHKKRADRVAQGVGPEFKSQYWKKKKEYLEP